MNSTLEDFLRNDAVVNEHLHYSPSNTDKRSFPPYTLNHQDELGNDKDHVSSLNQISSDLPPQSNLSTSQQLNAPTYQSYAAPFPHSNLHASQTFNTRSSSPPQFPDLSTPSRYNKHRENTSSSRIGERHHKSQPENQSFSDVILETQATRQIVRKCIADLETVKIITKTLHHDIKSIRSE
jgi:hypothetical protein